MKIVRPFILALFSLTLISSAQETKPASTANTADWYKNAESQMVFFTVLEGLYRDGVPQEAVDLIIGHVQSNNLERAFVFKCKLCHASYEAFAVYQRRPKFNGADGRDTIGNKPVPADVMQGLKSGGHRFNVAFASIIQPWIRQKIKALELNDDESSEMMKRFVDLAAEGNSLRISYTTCQACDAIEAIALQMGKSKQSKTGLSRKP